MKLAYRSLALAASLLTLAACSQASASTFVRNGEDPAVSASRHSIQFVRDSVFHSYLDSLDLRIETLNQAARTVDSLARQLRAMPKIKVHVNGHCFGPLHIPSQTLGVDSITVTTPEITIPEIEIPDVDIEVPHVGTDGTRLYDGPKAIVIDPKVSQYITKASPDPASEYYYSSGTSRYYIRNVKPDLKAKRAGTSSSVWLLDSK